MSGSLAQQACTFIYPISVTLLEQVGARAAWCSYSELDQLCLGECGRWRAISELDSPQ